MAGAITLPAGGTQAGSPQPQTTVEAPGGPFLRHTQPGRRQLYQSTGNSFGTTITQPIPGASGYYSKLRLKTTVTGGTGTSAVFAADAPYNIAQMINFQDSFGTPLIVAPGYEALYLIPKFSSTFGLGLAAEISNLPSWSGGTTAGNLSFSSVLPFEFVKCYGVVSGANASLQPKLITNLNTSAQVYTTAPGGTPVIEMDVDADFYWLPEGTEIEPPGLGTTQQWIYQPASPTIGSAASSRVALPRLGGYLSALLLEIRDSTQARVDGWPTGANRLRMYVDGIPEYDTKFSDLQDDMYVWYNGTSRPTGVIAFDRKNSLAQNDLGLLDTGELFLSTSPGTLVELEGAPWNTITNSPATLNCILGQIIPSGTLVQGLQEA